MGLIDSTEPEDIAEFLERMYDIDSATAEAFTRMTRLYVEKSYGKYEADISFVHHYTMNFSRSKAKAWVEDYMRNRYPNLELKYDGDAAWFVIPRLWKQ